ncbi:inter-alpha-trypsin inhibitor heavy chain H4-like isoform X1 [Diorhabda carinulata]|uniref:inter-alpha-trypsin inhibitor heavy chain H4-like isoform X1 n=1 Tax=Diorhabda carinulata TaxID=1163345 RepID=UPI0025A22BAF|nr:inter-alpha-trypsin inhibitor heavy chain H4-like isoform X1 [Diorhabda carinulata]
MNYKLLILPILVILHLNGVFGAPGDVSFIVSSTETTKEGENKADNNNNEPIIYAMDINTNVANRYAKTLITSKVKNPATSAKEATFSVVLPKKAFISEFVMQIGGKNYKAYVKEKEEAKHIYDEAVASGQSAAHVAVSARDSNTFTVSVNVEGEAKATFFLTYEELLERKDEKYEVVLNIHPGQVVDDLNVKVFINETRALRFVETPSLRSGNEISKNDDQLKPNSNIEIVNSTTAVVKFHPDAEAQKEFGKKLIGKESEGLSGQFIVQYDVERDPFGGEVLLQDGYFVHFFAPKDAETLPKNIYFILDTSSSMYGVKIQHLKDAMSSILNEIKPEDTLSIVEFNSEIFVWNIEHQNTVPVNYNNYQEPFEQLNKNDLPGPIQATKEAIEKARNLVNKMVATGGTFMIGGLEVGLYLAKTQKERVKDTDDKKQPIIIFLTDGQPNIGVHSTNEITKLTTRLNKDINAPIFSLSFGEGADKSFLRKISLENTGFSRHIYDAADASLQLQDFYKQVSSPLLSKVHFKYAAEAKEVTKTDFPIYFRGGELVISGCYSGSTFSPIVDAVGPRGPITWKPKIQEPVTSLERLWAYLTVRETLDEREITEDNDKKSALTKKALKIALKYSFVTDITSLVVVRPNVTNPIETRPWPRRRITPYLYNMRADQVHHSSFDGYSKHSYIAAMPTAQSEYEDSDVDTRSYLSAKPLMFRSSTKKKISIFPHSLSAGRFNYYTTPRLPPSPPTSTTEVPKNTTVAESLKWLSSALNANGTLTLPSGTLKIGDESLNFTPTNTCAKTPKGTEGGLCTLIKDCPEVFSDLTDFETYKQYSCPVQNEYAGVCCPKKTVSA